MLNTPAFARHPPLKWPVAHLRRLGGLISEALFPGNCCHCGVLFKIPAIRRSPGDHDCTDLVSACLCGSCREQLPLIDSPLCPQCGVPFETDQAVDHPCPQCTAHPFRFQAARAAGVYSDGWRAMIQHYKYQGRETMAIPLGRMLWRTLCRFWQPDRFDRIVPVPLHPRRRRQRGFDQAYQLVREWPVLARCSGIEPEHDWIDTASLKRERYTPPQTGLKKRERQANLRYAFRVTSKQRVAARRVLLVDDVLTTGATADACADALIRAGAADVTVLTLARTV